MRKREDNCQELYQNFQKGYSRLFRQPIIKSFLQDKNHKRLVKQAVCWPTRENRKLVDVAFKKFYGNVRMLTYLSNLIYYNAVNFDQAINKHYNREVLTLDQPLRNEEGIEGSTYKDMLYCRSPDIIDQIVYENLADYVGNPQLHQAIQTLTPRQHEVLTYKYVYGLKNKEIANLLEVSPQNISKHHQRALKRLKKQLTKEKNSHDS